MDLFWFYITFLELVGSLGNFCGLSWQMILEIFVLNCSKSASYVSSVKCQIKGEKLKSLQQIAKKGQNHNKNFFKSLFSL